MKRKLALLTALVFLITCGSFALAAGTVYGATGNSNIRTGPGLSYKDIGTLLKGTSATYLGESQVDSRGVTWYYVNYSGITGWVSEKYTSFNGGSSGSSFNTGSGIVTAVSGNTNLRTGPGLTYTDIGTLHVGESASYLGSVSTDDRGIDWYYVNLNGTIGWVSSYYTTLNGGYYSSAQYVYGNTGDSNVRTGPGLSYTDIGTLHKGESALFTGSTSVDNRGVTWYSVNYNGTAAWISSRYTVIR